MSVNRKDWLADTIRREGDVLFSTHPSAPDLVRFAEADDRMTVEQQQDIEAHLRVCVDCESDLSRLVAASRELEQGVRRHGPASGRDLPSRIREWFAPSRWVPAVVAVAVTVAILGPKTDEAVIHPVGRAVVLRSDVERGAVPTVAPEPGGRLALSFGLPGTDTGPIMRCDVTVLDADGRMVASVQDVGAFDEYGTFVLTFDARGLAPGRYTLTARDRLGDRQFAFDLQRLVSDESSD